MVGVRREHAVVAMGDPFCYSHQHNVARPIQGTTQEQTPDKGALDKNRAR